MHLFGEASLIRNNTVLHLLKVKKRHSVDSYLFYLLNTPRASLTGYVSLYVSLTYPSHPRPPLPLLLLPGTLQLMPGAAVDKAKVPYSM